MSRRPKTKPPKRLGGSELSPPSVAAVIEVVETITKRAMQYVLLRQQGSALTAEQRLDADMLREVVEFVRGSERTAPTARKGKHVITRQDAENVRLRKVLRELPTEEEYLSPEERDRLTFLESDPSQLSKKELAELDALRQRDVELHQTRTDNRVLAFTLYGSPPVSREAVAAAREFIIDTDIRGRPLMTAHAAALRLIEAVYKRSARAQAVMTEAMENEFLASTTHLDPNAEGAEPLRFFVDWVLGLGVDLKPSNAGDAVVVAWEKYQTSPERAARYFHSTRRLKKP